MQSVSLSPEVDEQIQIIASVMNLPLFSVSFFLPSILFRYRYDQKMAVPTSWQEGRNSIVTTVSRKTAHRRISFLIVAVSAPERHWIGFQSHFARAAHATYSVGMVRSSGRTHNNIDRYIQARAWQYEFHHLTYLREACFARQLWYVQFQFIARACHTQRALLQR